MGFVLVESSLRGAEGAGAAGAAIHQRGGCWCLPRWYFWLLHPVSLHCLFLFPVLVCPTRVVRYCRRWSQAEAGATAGPSAKEFMEYVRNRQSVTFKPLDDPQVGPLLPKQ